MPTRPTDPFFTDQWWLENAGQFGGTAGIDLNLITVWDEFNGAGVKVGVYDTGVLYTHPDIAGNYDSALHITIDGAVHDPFPDTSDRENAHGTAVAGQIAGVADNGLGVASVAFGATMAGFNVFADPFLDADWTSVMAQAYRQQADHFDVTNHSYSAEFFSTNYLISDQAQIGEAIAFAAENGRGGLGTVMTIANGNTRTMDGPNDGGADGNYNNLANDRHVVAVAALDDDGEVTVYSTPGANLLVSAAIDRHQGFATSNKTVTTDFLGVGQGMGTGADSDLTNGYTDLMNGTSAATPAVSGVIALMFEANPFLGYRDVREILALTARLTGGDGEFELYPWQTNGAAGANGGGMHFSQDYGFGRVDGLGAVRLAESWGKLQTSANEVVIASNADDLDLSVPDGDASGTSTSFIISDDIRVETVEVTLDFTYESIGDLKITLTSPNGTESVLLNRPFVDQIAYDGTISVTEIEFSDDASRVTATEPGTLSYKFSTNASFGESSPGTWTLTIADVVTGGTATLNDFEVAIHGSSDTADDLYVFTDEFSLLASVDDSRQSLADVDGGVDTLNAAAVTTGSAIDLTAGTTSTIAGTGLTIDSAATIEIAHGGDGADSIAGNEADNTLYGWRGADTISGGTGTDVLYGGAGFDTVRFGGSRAAASLAIGDDAATVAGTDGTDSVFQFERYGFDDREFDLVARFTDDTGASTLTRDSTEIETLRADADWTFDGYAFGGIVGEAGATPVDVYSFTNIVNGTLFYTAGADERDALISGNPLMRYESIAFSALDTSATDTTAVYRLYDSTNLIHIYTADESERDALDALDTITYEQIAWYGDTLI